MLNGQGRLRPPVLVGPDQRGVQQTPHHLEGFGAKLLLLVQMLPPSAKRGD